MTENTTPTWVKHLAQWIGALLFVLGLGSLLNLFCISLVVLFDQPASVALVYSIFSLVFSLFTFGAGLVLWRFADDALKGKPSRPLRLPPAPLLLGVFGLLMVVGGIITGFEILPGLFFGPVFVILAALPPLWAVAWFAPKADSNPPGVSVENNNEGRVGGEFQNAENAHQPPPPYRDPDFITLRRGLTAFIGGGTIGVTLALVLEILLPVIVLALVFGLFATVRGSLETLFRALSYSESARALSAPGFIYLFIQLAVIAPLAEELAKPLVLLPLLKRLDEKQTFLLGALAGAGFAALENIIYAASGNIIWAGIFLVRALGGALHPLCAGLVALGWRAVLRGAPNAGKKWLLRFGAAVLLHAVWNGGSLLVITLGGARFFGELPPEINLLGLSAAGVTLAFLLLLGLAALWFGRAIGHGQPLTGFGENAAPESDFLPSDRALAIWALACLAALVPAGIAGLKLWLR